MGVHHWAVYLTQQQTEVTIIETEAILNARPLTYVDRNPEARIITLNNFLRAKLVAIPVNPNREHSEENVRKLWRSSQVYLDTFWHQWVDSNLLLLRKRNDQLRAKRSNAEHSLMNGEIVVVQDL